VHRLPVIGRVGSIARVVEVEIGDQVLAALAQLLGHVVVAVPYRRRLQRRIGDLFGSARRRS